MLLCALTYAAVALLGLVNAAAVDMDALPAGGHFVRVDVGGTLKDCYEHNHVILFCAGEEGERVETTVTLVPEVPASATSIPELSTVIVTAAPITATERYTATKVVTTTETHIAYLA